MKTSVQFLSLILFTTLAANSAKSQSFQVTGGTVSAYARVGDVEGVPNEQNSTAFLPNPGNGQQQVATKNIADESMKVTSLTNVDTCLIHGAVTLDYLKNTTSIGPSQGIGGITVGFQVTKSDWYYVDTFLNDSQIEDAEVRITTDPTGVNQAFGFRQRDGVSGWQSDRLVNLNAGTQYVMVGTVNLIVPPGQENPVNSSETLQFNLRCLSGLRPTLSPDLNQDGAVDADDARLLFESWGPYTAPIGSSTASYDLNLDLVIDTADAGLLFASWTGDSTNSSATSVPEPASGMAIGLAIAMCTLTRRTMAR